MSNNIGDIITVKTDPDTNGGFDTAPALITGVYEDGSLRLRVLGATGADDTTRNYAGQDGEPFDEAAYAEQQQTAQQSDPAAEPDASSPSSSSSSTSDTSGSQPAAPTQDAPPPAPIV